MKSAKLFMGLLAISLLLLVPGLAHAQSAPNADAEGSLRGFEGEVVNGAGALSEDGMLTIKDHRTGEERMIRMTSSNGQPNFRIKTPGKTDLPDFASSMQPGVGVAVLARQVEGQWTAMEVLVKPEEPTAPPRSGVVMESNPAEGTITILTSNGVTQTLQLEDGAPAPGEGDLVIAFAGPSRGASGAAGLERVTGLTRAAEVRERLESHLAAVSSDQSVLNGADPVVKANHAESLTELLDHQTTRHFERLEKALDHTTIGNQRSVIGALVQTGNARQQGRIRAAQVRAAKANEGSQSVDNGENVKDNQGQGNRNSVEDNSGKSSVGNDVDNPGKKAEGKVKDRDSSRDNDSRDSNAGGSSDNSNDDNSNAGGNSDNSNAGGNSDNSNAGGNSDNSNAGGKGKGK